MRPVSLVLFFVATAALGSSVGDTYDKVIAERGAPKSQIQAGTVKVLAYSDVTIKLRDGIVVSIKAVAPAPPPAPAQAGRTPASLGQQPSAAQQVAAIKREMMDAVEQVKTIVNQPVPTTPITPEISRTIGRWGDIWFHPGATVPDFNNVDVRATQETSKYDKFEYITSNLNPGVAFPGGEVEFNSMTKFFYVDRSLPKKKLTEEEMVEINRLYRIIGRCWAQLGSMGVQVQIEPPAQ
jgi:hypothetical protein